LSGSDSPAAFGREDSRDRQLRDTNAVEGKGRKEGGRETERERGKEWREGKRQTFLY